MPNARRLQPRYASHDEAVLARRCMRVGCWRAFVTADMAGKVDSPLYGMFKMRSAVKAVATPDGLGLEEFFSLQPDDAWRGYSLKWDGESSYHQQRFHNFRFKLSLAGTFKSDPEINGRC